MKHISFFGSTIRETIDVLKRRDIEVDFNFNTPQKYKLSDDFKDFQDGYKKGRKARLKDDYETPIGKIGKSAINNVPYPTSIFEDRTKVIMRIVVTVVLLTISFYLLIEKGEQSKTLPCSIISAVTGYWLK